MKKVEVTLHRGIFAKISVDGGSRKNIDASIDAYLRAHKDEIVWKDNPKGISADCNDGVESWKPQKRFHLNGDSEW